MMKKLTKVLISTVLFSLASSAYALPPNTPEPGDQDALAICAAAAKVSLHFIDRDKRIRAGHVNALEVLNDLEQSYKKQRAHFERKLRKETSRKEADARIDEEVNAILLALQTQEVEGDVLATDNLRKRKLDEWYTDYCQSQWSMTLASN